MFEVSVQYAGTSDDHNLQAHKRLEPVLFFPTKARITLIRVSKGAKYDPMLVPNLPAAGKNLE